MVNKDAYIYATVKDSDFKYGTQLGFDEYHVKTTFRNKFGGAWTWGASEKFWNPLISCAAVEANDFKFGT